MLEHNTDGWYVESGCERDGTVVFKVRTCLAPSESDISVKHYPRWMFWIPSFDKRVRKASDAAQKRAWELNQQVIKSRQKLYDLKMAAAKSNE